MKWFDRAFSFDIPAWMFPNVVERLRGTPPRVENLVRNLAHADLVLCEAGRWSIQENIGHLMDLEDLWLARVEDVLSGQPRLRNADLTNRKTHEANHNDADIEALLVSFSRLREKLVARIEIVSDADVVLSALHPRLEQPMRLIDLAFFVAEHDDHHLAEITRLKRGRP